MAIPNRAPTASSTRMPSGTTSLPIPSPGMTAIFSLVLGVPCAGAGMAFPLVDPFPTLYPRTLRAGKVARPRWTWSKSGAGIAEGVRIGRPSAGRGQAPASAFVVSRSQGKSLPCEARGLTPGPVHARVAPRSPSSSPNPEMHEPTKRPEPAPAIDPAAQVDAIARDARKTTTPCGEGTMVWRVWGAGDPLVLFHGGSGSWTHWIRVIPELSRHYELWVADIPGLGDSAMPPKPWVPQSTGEVVVAGLEQLFAKEVELRLAGFSFGGQIAGLAAAQLGDRVRSLTLIGVAALGLPTVSRPPFAKRRAGMSAAEVAAAFRQNLEILMFANPGNIDALAIHLQAQNIARARFRSRPFAGTDTLARALERVKAHLKTIWGTRDIVARPSLEARLDVLRRHHPDLKVSLIEGAGHWVMYEAAAEFNAAFLALQRS